jgi:4-hydroxy-4-methyl-2-oxoglutarate aldolase
MKEDTAALCARLRDLQPAVVCDVLDAMGWPDQVLSSQFTILDPKTKIAGPAFCLRGSTTVGSGKPAPAGQSKPVYEMDRRLYEGCVAVVETGGHKAGAIVGSNVILGFKLRGCRGIVVEGGIRDAAEFIEMGFPTFYTFLTPLSNKGRWEFTDSEVPIRLPGQTAASVVVNPGDLIVGDSDGLVIVPRAIAADAIAAAEIAEGLEHKIKEELGRGDDREAVYKRNDRFAHVHKKR